MKTSRLYFLVVQCLVLNIIQDSRQDRDLRSPANAVRAVFLLAQALKVDVVGIDASKPARLGAVYFLKLDHHVHHLLDREVALVVAERHVRLSHLLALAIEPDTGE